MVSGRQIAAARTLLGISQNDLALASDVSKRTIIHFEGGGRTPHDRTVEALVKAMNAMGIEFLEDDVGVGIRMTKAKALELSGGAQEPD
jgi:transcriptional regulator with XRE-family HTH domain